MFHIWSCRCFLIESRCPITSQETQFGPLFADELQAHLWQKFNKKVVVKQLTDVSEEYNIFDASQSLLHWCFLASGLHFKL